jgi:uncharacterized protein (UPF0335 family)
MSDETSDPAPAGHNSVASGQLQSIIERVERLEEEKTSLLEDMKYVYSEAKGNGYNTKAIKRLVTLRKLDRTKLAEDKAMLELYAAALGCLDLV